MRLAIGAWNIRSGGGLNHLSELLIAGNPQDYGFSETVVWGATEVIDRLPEKPGLRLVHEQALQGSIVQRLIWQQRVLPHRLAEGFDLLLVPSGIYFGSFRPFVAMSQNLLPFDFREIRRYANSKQVVRLLLLRLANRRTYRRTDSTIFLTNYARDRVVGTRPHDYPRPVVIRTGVDDRFRRQPRPQRPIEAYSTQRPYRLLYVSIINRYKHQWHVVEAVGRLKQKGLPLTLDLVGPAETGALQRLTEMMDRVDPGGVFVKYHGAVPYSEMHSLYEQADAFVFASSCEALPQIVLEAMSAGLPIACSDRSALPEVMNGTGSLFDPENVDDIEQSLQALLQDPTLRHRLAAAAYEEVLQYSWDRYANKMLEHLATVAKSCARA